VPDSPANFPPPSIEDWLAVATTSHLRLAEIVGTLSPEEVAGPSYASEWSIAQVLSHLGSGAEIFTLYLQAGLGGEPAPGMPEFAPIWERWNAKSTSNQAEDALVADRAFLDHVTGLDYRERQGWRVQMMGAEQQLTDLLRLRVGEHALHTWDVAVAGNPTATLAPDAVALLIDTIDQLVGRVGQPAQPPLRLPISTEQPTRRFLLDADADGAELRPGIVVTDSGWNDPLDLPAEALIRLVYGRLDPRHTSSVHADLDALRRIFPGF